MGVDTTPDELSDELFFANGINGATGAYDLPPMNSKTLVDLVTGAAKPEDVKELAWLNAQMRGGFHLGLVEGLDSRNLAESGWGAIFPSDTDPAIQEALAPLFDLRRKQAGDLFKICDQADGYRPGEKKTKFLKRFRMGPGPVRPEKLPYYLLLVGSPQEIPYRFQSQLSVQFAVGRIHFEHVEDYANYALSVVQAESDTKPRSRDVTFFGVENPMDRATRASSKRLIAPVVEHLHTKSEAAKPWTIKTSGKDTATKANLTQHLGGPKTPALLFTASHGMAFPNGDPKQLPHQGALLCRDWPGPGDWREPIPQDFYFAGDDLESSADLSGLIAFFFACYGAGTPQYDEFAKQAFLEERQSIAPHPFQAALPSQMLGQAKGGALAVVGHVERAWGCSFQWPGASSQTAVFESTLDSLLAGFPIGAAMEYFGRRHAELSTTLVAELEDIEFGAEPDEYELASMWTANNDARGYTIIGDPAVRLQGTVR